MITLYALRPDLVTFVYRFLMKIFYRDFHRQTFVKQNLL